MKLNVVSMGIQLPANGEIQKEWERFLDVDVGCQLYGPIKNKKV